MFTRGVKVNNLCFVCWLIVVGSNWLNTSYAKWSVSMQNHDRHYAAKLTGLAEPVQRPMLSPQPKLICRTGTRTFCPGGKCVVSKLKIDKLWQGAVCSRVHRNKRNKLVQIQASSYMGALEEETTRKFIGTALRWSQRWRHAPTAEAARGTSMTKRLCVTQAESRTWTWGLTWRTSWKLMRATKRRRNDSWRFERWPLVAVRMIC